MKKKKTKQHCNRIVGVRFSDRVYKQVAKAAASEKLAVSTMIRVLIEKYVESRGAA